MPSGTVPSLTGRSSGQTLLCVTRINGREALAPLARYAASHPDDPMSVEIREAYDLLAKVLAVSYGSLEILILCNK